MTFSDTTQPHSLLCVGLDADITRIADADQFAFNRRVIDQTHPYACAYKLNSAFYEARGADGWTAMAQTVAYIRQHHPQMFLICDAKRADIGSSNVAYARAVFDELGFDAVTLHPYLGGEALAPFLNRADKVSIILCRTSNPGAREIQDHNDLWQHVARTVVNKWNANGNCMLVVGATYPDDLRTVRGIVGDMPLLVPGVGAQGADPAKAVRAGQNSHGGGLYINASRSIIFADDPATAAHDLHAALNAARNKA